MVNLSHSRLLLANPISVSHLARLTKSPATLRNIYVIKSAIGGANINLVDLTDSAQYSSSDAMEHVY